MSSSEKAPLIDGDVIVHSKQPLSQSFSFEGRLKNLFCHFQVLSQRDFSTIELHCEVFVW